MAAALGPKTPSTSTTFADLLAVIRLLKTPIPLAATFALALVMNQAALAQPSAQPMPTPPAQGAAPAPAQATVQAPVHVAPPPKVAAQPSAPAPSQASATGALVDRGLAAVYSNKLHGRKTANGERYDRSKLTTAHPSLPFGTMLRVTNVKNNKSVVVRVNDRGPTQAGRIVDLSPRAAKVIGLGPRSMAEVTIRVVKQGNGKRAKAR
jgi:rare lipoprotein A